MSIPSIGLKDLLVAANIGSFGTTNIDSVWPIIIGTMPDEPVNCILLTDSGGRRSEPRYLLDYPTISVFVRAKTYVSCYNKIKEIKDCVFSLPAQDINGDHWSGVIMASEIGYVGRDSRDRHNFSCSFSVFFEPADSAGDHRIPL